MRQHSATTAIAAVSWKGERWEGRVGGWGAGDGGCRRSLFVCTKGFLARARVRAARRSRRLVDVDEDALGADTGREREGDALAEALLAGRARLLMVLHDLLHDEHDAPC